MSTPFTSTDSTPVKPITTSDSRFVNPDKDVDSLHNRFYTSSWGDPGSWSRSQPGAQDRNGTESSGEKGGTLEIPPLWPKGKEQDIKESPMLGSFDKQPNAVKEQIDGLIKKLNAPDGKDREQAQEQLKQYGHAAAQRLVRNVDSDSYRERDAAERQLIRMGAAAVPALYDAIEKPLSVHQLDRAPKVLDNIVKSSSDTEFRDGQGRIRRVVDGTTREMILEANYNKNGDLSDATIRGAKFSRQDDGSYVRSDTDGKYNNVHVTAGGGLSFQIGDSKGSIEWAADGRTLIVDPDGTVNTIIMPDGKQIDRMQDGKRFQHSL